METHAKVVIIGGGVAGCNKLNIDTKAISNTKVVRKLLSSPLFTFTFILSFYKRNFLIYLSVFLYKSHKATPQNYQVDPSIPHHEHLQI